MNTKQHDRLRAGVLWLVLSGVLLAFAGAASADVVVPEPQLYEEEAGTPGSGFVPAPEGEGENINGGALMLVAYGVFWVLILGYVGTLASRARRDSTEMGALRRQVTDLEDRLDEIETGA